MAVVDSEIANNTTGGDAGGIGNVFGDLFIGYCTIASNTAGLDGGGIENGGTMQAINVTIADNSVATAGDGGGLYGGTSSTTLDNTIVAQNTANTGANPEPADDIGGTVSQSSANNLIGTGGAGGLTNGASGNQVGVASDNIGLEGLFENGGPTETIALEPISPAIDAGANIPANRSDFGSIPDDRSARAGIRASRERWNRHRRVRASTRYREHRVGPMG